MNFSDNIKTFSVSKEKHKKFKDYFWIKNNPTQVETEFYKKTEKYLKYISWIPGIRMIWIWNSISMNCATPDSDIDLYIVTSPNRMWLVRILITLIFQILWVRKTPKKHAWRFCLSFFSTTNSLNFWEFALEEDIYLYFWILYFKPILDINSTYNKFLEQNKAWLDFSEYTEIISQNKKYIKYSKNIPEQNIFSKLWDILDDLLKKLFLPKTIKHYKNLWKPYGIIINENMLKFHNWDVRKDVIDINL
jgi:hypothetical protein